MAGFTDGHFISVMKLSGKNAWIHKRRVEAAYICGCDPPDYRAEDVEAVNGMREGKIHNTRQRRDTLKKNGEAIWATRSLTKIRNFRRIILRAGNDRGHHWTQEV